MTSKTWIRLTIFSTLVGAVLALMLALRARTAYVPDIKTYMVTYPLPGTSLQGIGRLQIPTDLSAPSKSTTSPSHTLGAVVIVHGTGGPDAKAALYAQALNASGIVTLEIDLWSPRGLTGGWDDRPKHVVETLPDTFGALNFLAAQPRVDPQRIGIMGFSWGGVVAMLAADQHYAEEMSPDRRRFAAHMPFYPICFAYNRLPGYRFRELTGAPIYILTGAADKYDNDASMCPRLADSLPSPQRAAVKVKVYPQVEHGFNNLDAPRTYEDPYHYQGKGGLGGSTPNAAARADSVQEAVRFFSQNLKKPGPESAPLPIR